MSIRKTALATICVGMIAAEVIADSGVLSAELGRQQVCGRIRAYATPGTRPYIPCPFDPNECACCPVDTPCADPVLTAVEGILVSIDGGGSAYTASDGTFCIEHEGIADITVRACLDEGEYVYVTDDTETDVLEVSMTAAPATYFDMTMNSSWNEYTTAQVNAFIAANKAYNFWLDRTNDFEPLSGAEKLEMLVNLPSSTCSTGSYSPLTITINAPMEGLCAYDHPMRNSAYSVMTSHEFGHFVLLRHIGDSMNSDNAFAEGFSDSLAYLVYDTPTLGDWGFMTGGYLRDTEERNKQYPYEYAGQVCGNPMWHDAGQILSGVWWDMRKNFGDTYGSANGLFLAQQLFVDWSQLTNGSEYRALGTGDSRNSAYPGTMQEVLTADDALAGGDNDLSNGTPRYADIAAAFASHGICWTGYSCPGDFDCDGEIGLSDLALLLASYPKGSEAYYHAHGDMDFDGDVDLSDLGMLLSVYETTCD